MRNALYATGALLAMIAVHVQAINLLSLTDVVTYAGMDDANPPSGWVIMGEKEGTDMVTHGAGKVVWDFCQGGQGFIRLTTTQYDRAGLYYTNDPVWSTDFKIDAEIRVAPGGGGMAFSWIEVPTNGASADSFTNQMLGGFSYFLGAPRGQTLTNEGLGWSSDIRGYSLQFFTSSNDLVSGDTEMTVCRNLADWSPFLGSLTNGSFVNSGFVEFKLIQTMQGADGLFRLTWGPTFSETNSWIIPNYPNYPAYFGVSAATGPVGTSHDVRNVALYGDVVPEPGTAVVVLALAAVIRRRR